MEKKDKRDIENDKDINIIYFFMKINKIKKQIKLKLNQIQNNTITVI